MRVVLRLGHQGDPVKARLFYSYMLIFGVALLIWGFQAEDMPVLTAVFCFSGATLLTLYTFAIFDRTER